MTDLTALRAVDMATLVRTREISCVELLDAHLDRIARVNPDLNAIVTLVPERAREQARALDRAYPLGLPREALPPLFGLPVAHKDLVLTRGIRTTFGSTLHADFVPRTDDLIVERMRAAGAVCLGKTNTPEFGAGSQTFNRVFGATLNPCNRRLTCGGSSGGAAAALGAHLVPIADGSDLGGSMRNPAAFCGVLGLRPTPGRVPVHPQRNPWFDLSVQGPMARNVDDLALLLSAIAGPNPRVPVALDEPGASFYPVVPLAPRGLRVALSPDLGGLPVEAAIREATLALGIRLERAGVAVALDCPDFSGAREIFHVLRANSMRARFRDLPPADRAELKDTLRWNIEAGERLTTADLDRAATARAALYQRVAAFFARYDFLVCPTTQVLPFPVEIEWVREIEGVPMRDYLDWMQSCAQITVTGCPALSLPNGVAPDGRPIGVQIVAPVRAERRLLSFARLIEGLTT
jgi:amidase